MDGTTHSNPFAKDDASLAPDAGACIDCPKRNGFNAVLFGDMGAGQDSCTDPKCYYAKLDAHVQKTVAAYPKLVQISTAYGQPKDGAAAIPRNKYVLLRDGKPEHKLLTDAFAASAPPLEPRTWYLRHTETDRSPT